MKYLLGIIFFSFLFMLPAGHAYAETSVDIENNGDGSTSEVHVENSVDNGDNTTTVCINGKCETSKDGNIERQEGGAKVKVENSNQKNVEGGVVIITPSQTPGQEASESAEASISAKKDEVKDPSASSHSASSGQAGQQFNLEEIMKNIREWMNEFFSSNN